MKKVRISDKVKPFLDPPFSKWKMIKRSFRDWQSHSLMDIYWVGHMYMYSGRDMHSCSYRDVHRCTLRDRHSRTDVHRSSCTDGHGISCRHVHRCFCSDWYWHCCRGGLGHSCRWRYSQWNTVWIIIEQTQDTRFKGYNLRNCNMVGLLHHPFWL